MEEFDNNAQLANLLMELSRPETLESHEDVVRLVPSALTLVPTTSKNPFFLRVATSIARALSHVHLHGPESRSTELSEVAVSTCNLMRTLLSEFEPEATLAGNESLVADAYLRLGDLVRIWSIGGERESGLAEYNRGLRLCDRGSHPELWAELNYRCALTGEPTNEDDPVFASYRGAICTFESIGDLLSAAIVRADLARAYLTLASHEAPEIAISILNSAWSQVEGCHFVSRKDLANVRGTILHRLAMAFRFRRFGDRIANLHTARDLCERALDEFSAVQRIAEVAMVQSDLGNIFIELRDDEREAKLANAVRILTAAETAFRRLEYFEDAEQVLRRLKVAISELRRERSE